MLTVDTKKHIDSARQILVGKVPDPKQQIDQITNALIYKFMDDMDIQAKDAGGKPSFFTGDLEPYAWRKIMAPQLGAQERMDLYTRALTKFSAADQLPQLFRDIFRQAFLPYRDPETLNLFLKEIEFFDYSHSEELGNAFEYLLSIMGSQGDAGQFRTPRHIIDFIVEIVDPDKDDTILDPACGTAGFLISAYKHIVQKHEGKDKKPLTHSEKQKLMDNLEGYDISSDMVKLARVNMYLHSNNQPKIFEYDSLTSQEHWGESFDVMLANPPFMSPKGGINPHDKFGVTSSRSEVLFVDYIMTHLKRNGRAGIIVPEGIIFQGGKAHKQLRKALIEDGLMAVISLPAGVFNPYSGVKTSILIFDNNRTKLSKDIVFAKVAHDGFDLGAQRRPMLDKTDLPIIAKALRKYRHGELQVQKQMDTFLEDQAAYQSSEAFVFTKVPEIQLVERSKIIKSGDYNLSASRYAATARKQNQKWPMVRIGDVADLTTGGTPRSTNPDYYGGDVKWLVSGDIHRGEIYDCEGRITELALKESNAKLLPLNSVLIALNGQGKTRGTVALLRTEATCNQSIVAIKPKEGLLSEFLYYILKSMYQQIRDITGEGHRSGLNMPIIRNIEIPLPQIEVQQQIVEELGGYQKIIDGANQVIKNYKPTINIDPAWPLVKLKELIGSLEAGVSVNSESRPAEKNEKGVLKTSAVTYGVFKPEENKVILASDLSRARISPKRDNILISRMNTEQLVGASVYIDKDYDNLFLPDRLWQTVRARNDFSMKYLSYTISSPHFRKKLSGIASGTSGSMKNISKVAILELEIPLPPLSTQEKITQTIEEMDIGVTATQKMLKIYEQKLKDKIAEVRGE